MTYEEKITYYNHQIDAVSQLVLHQMKAGAAKWEMPWHKGIPQAQNLFTGKFYGGRNMILLWQQCLQNKYLKNGWATFAQWRKIGAKIKKGERGTLICIAIPRRRRITRQHQSELFNSIEYSKIDRNNVYFTFRFKHVFNQSQVNGYFGDQPSLFNDPLPGEAKLKKLVAESGAKITENGDSAYYSLNSDTITIPPIYSFKATQESSKEENYYSTLMHEIIHWTGHHTRCSREFGKTYGDPQYAFEELIAELGSAILCTQLNQRIVPRIDHAQYLNFWLKVLKEEFSYFTEALELARTAIYYLNELTGIYSDLKPQHQRKISEKRLKEWSKMATKEI